jgi:hypothetical protein
VYHDVQDGKGELVETGTVCPIPTLHAKVMLAELVEAGIRPPVLILRWSPLGNHFQAVHYKADDYESYAKNIVDLAATRNKILAKYGWKELVALGYDVGKTTKAANEALAALRKHAKARKGVAQQVTTSTAVRIEPR